MKSLLLCFAAVTALDVPGSSVPVRHKFASRRRHTLLLASIEAGVGSVGGCAAGWKEAKPGVIYLQKITAELALPPCAVERKHAQLYI